MDSQLAAWRRTALGASDAPALVGVDPYRSAGDVWAEKTGRYVHQADDAGDAAKIGSALEPVLLDIVQARLGRLLARQVFYRHPELPLAASVDGVALDGDPGVLVEAKTAGLLSASAPLVAAYGDEGSDEVPQSVTIQVAHQLAVLDAQPDVPHVTDVFVPALLGGRGFHCYHLRRDDDLMAELVQWETEWWERHVVGDRCPPDDPPSLPVLRAFRRRADAPAVPLDEATVAAWLAARDAKRQAEDAEDAARRNLVVLLDDAEAGECALGRVSYRAAHYAEHLVKAHDRRTLRFHAPRATGRAA